MGVTHVRGYRYIHRAPIDARMSYSRARNWLPTSDVELGNADLCPNRSGTRPKRANSGHPTVQNLPNDIGRVEKEKEEEETKLKKNFKKEKKKNCSKKKKKKKNKEEVEDLSFTIF